VKLRRLKVSPGPFSSLLAGELRALIVPDDGVRVGDEYALERTLGGQYVGPQGTYAVTVTHVDHGCGLLPEGYALVSLKGTGRHARTEQFS
jgi:hypothetical protein